MIRVCWNLTLFALVLTFFFCVFDQNNFFTLKFVIDCRLTAKDQNKTAILLKIRPGFFPLEALFFLFRFPKRKGPRAQGLKSPRRAQEPKKGPRAQEGPKSPIAQEGPKSPIAQEGPKSPIAQEGPKSPRRAQDQSPIRAQEPNKGLRPQKGPRAQEGHKNGTRSAQ
jgi:hypothetical protein